MSENKDNTKYSRDTNRPNQYLNGSTKRITISESYNLSDDKGQKTTIIPKNITKEETAVSQPEELLEKSTSNLEVSETLENTQELKSTKPQVESKTDVSSDYGIDISNIEISTIAEKVSANSGDSAFTTASLKAVPKEKKTIDTPLGIYILAGCYLVIFGMGFLNSSVISKYYAGLMLVNLILAISLLLRKNIIRKLVIVVSVITFGLSIFSMFMVTSMMNDVNNLKNQYENTIKSIDTESQDAKQKQLEILNLKIENKKMQTGKVNGLTYAKLTLTLVGNIGTVIYLTRPRVKLAFTEKKIEK